jgi:hypothetical protein
MLIRTFFAALTCAMITGTAQAIPVHINDVQNFPVHQSPVPDNSLALDIDSDGSVDIYFGGQHWIRTHNTTNAVLARYWGLLIYSGLNSRYYAGPRLQDGDLIDGTMAFGSYPGTVIYHTAFHNALGKVERRTRLGIWSDDWTATDQDPLIREGYMGLVLSSGRFGWVQMRVNGYGYGNVLAYGYETQVGVGVEAGALPPVPLPSTGWALLGALAGLHLLRRRKLG